jgi:BirA family biotin operon repressor/biotin-[acetyl-CoA-carboxylase] ligase
MAAVAVSEALCETYALTTDIKWPNDLLAGGKKLCGILAETVETPRGRAVVLGIGTNLTNDAFPKELEMHATSVEAATGQSANPEELLPSLISGLQKWYDALNVTTGSTKIIREWCARSSYADGRLVLISDGEQSFTGTTRGLESDGALRVETDAGKIKIVRAGDVSSVRPAK